MYVFWRRENHDGRKGGGHLKLCRRKGTDSRLSPPNVKLSGEKGAPTQEKEEGGGGERETSY